jgi:phosphatidylserine/phosphatidylglycerophosphate/cardiolipin synthase-like enzyme
VSDVFSTLSASALQALAVALEEGRLTTFSPSAIGRFLDGATRDAVSAELQRLGTNGMSVDQIAYLLFALAAVRTTANKELGKTSLVWSGPEAQGTRSRSSAAVARGLFRKAERSLLIASYVIDPNRDKAREIFGELAGKMDARTELSVRFFVNVQRPYQEDQTVEAVLLTDFASRFRDMWPGNRLPKVFYDPRALNTGNGPRASLHAKCVIVDDREALITSANFTEAAHGRNIEAGILIENPVLAQALRNQFDLLVNNGLLKTVPGIC